MKILITGATGLVGQHLLEELFLRGYDDINVLTRNIIKAKNILALPVNLFKWDPENNTLDNEALSNVDIVINLAGEGVADGYWTKKKKEKILNSRINGTRLLINNIKALKKPPQKFISASAIGIYGDRDEEVLNHNSEPGNGYLVEVCQKWESSALEHEIIDMKTIILRVGIVLSSKGGALAKMIPAFKAGIAGQLGNGDQYMSWIHINDLIGQFIFLIQSKDSQGIYNGVSPRPVTNLIFTKILGRILTRPTIFPLPKIILRLIFGEMSQILTNSQKVIPTKFKIEGYDYKFRSVKEALRDLLKNDLKREQSFTRFQWIDKKPENIFSFFSNEKNLEKLTPPFLNFKVLGKNTEKLGEGTYIHYKLKLMGIPFKWQSKITKFKENEYFTDEQIKGPYKRWVHSHTFLPIKNGTLIMDQITYKIPLGLIGHLLTKSFIKNYLIKIFDFRFNQISYEFSNAKETK